MLPKQMFLYLGVTPTGKPFQNIVDQTMPLVDRCVCDTFEIHGFACNYPVTQWFKPVSISEFAMRSWIYHHENWEITQGREGDRGEIRLFLKFSVHVSPSVPFSMRMIKDELASKHRNEHWDATFLASNGVSETGAITRNHDKIPGPFFPAKIPHEGIQSSKIPMFSYLKSHFFHMFLGEITIVPPQTTICPPQTTIFPPKITSFSHLNTMFPTSNHNVSTSNHHLSTSNPHFPR